MGFMKTIYIVHGWAYKTTHWTKFIDILKKKGFVVKLLQTPGLTQNNITLSSYDALLQWLDRSIKEKDQIYLLGHSFGGRLIMEYVLKYPKKIQAIILIDSAGVYHNDIVIVFKRTIFKIIAKIGKKITSSSTLKNLLYYVARENDYNKASSNMKRIMIEAINLDKKRDVSKITTPTYIVWGKYDKITPLSDGQYLHKNIINSKLYIIDKALHAPQFSHANKVASIIASILHKHHA